MTSKDMPSKWYHDKRMHDVEQAEWLHIDEDDHPVAVYVKTKQIPVGVGS